MKHYFDQKVKVDEFDDVSVNGLIVKTDQGIEFIRPSKQNKASDAASNQDGAGDGQQAEGATPKSASSLAAQKQREKEQAPRDTYGMPREVYELYMDLEEKWSMENLTRRFKERIEDHLRVNTKTKDSMLRSLNEISAGYSKV